MKDEAFITYSRGSFEIVRWAPAAALASLPFTFEQGVISAALFGGALLIAATWLVSLLCAWRTRSQLILGLGPIILIFGSLLVGVQSSGIPFPQFLQWLCYVVILTGGPLLFFRVRLYHFARLDENDVP